MFTFYHSMVQKNLSVPYITFWSQEMESERKRRRLSSSLTARKSEIQWQKCGDGFEELLLNIPKHNTSVRRNSKRFRETHRRKSLTGEITLAR